MFRLLQGPFCGFGGTPPRKVGIKVVVNVMADLTKSFHLLRDALFNQGVTVATIAKFAELSSDAVRKLLSRPIATRTRGLSISNLAAAMIHLAKVNQMLNQGNLELEAACQLLMNQVIVTETNSVHLEVSTNQSIVSHRDRLRDMECTCGWSEFTNAGGVGEYYSLRKRDRDGKIMVAKTILEEIDNHVQFTTYLPGFVFGRIVRGLVYKSNFNYYLLGALQDIRTYSSFTHEEFDPSLVDGEMLRPIPSGIDLMSISKNNLDFDRTLARAMSVDANGGTIIKNHLLLPVRAINTNEANPDRSLGLMIKTMVTEEKKYIFDFSEIQFFLTSRFGNSTDDTAVSIAIDGFLTNIESGI